MDANQTSHAGTYVELLRTIKYYPATQYERVARWEIGRLEAEKDRLGNELYRCIIERDKLQVEKTDLMKALKEIQEKTYIHSSAMALEISLITEAALVKHGGE